MARDALRAGDRIGAVAWLDYQRWLHRGACRADVSSVRYAEASRRASALRRAMRSTELESAVARGRALVDTHGPVAQRRLHCPADSGL